MVGRRARARGAGRSGVRSAWYHLQAERAVGRCAQQCEGRRAPAGGGEPSSALGIASEKTRAARAERAGRAEPGCAQAGGSSPSGSSAGVLLRPREESNIHNKPHAKRAQKHKTFTPRTHQASFTSHQHANGHTSTARSRRKSPRPRNLRGRKSDSQLYGHHMSRGSYDPMNCTASCFVVGPHLMMVLETFPLHLFPLGLTTTEKVRPALSRVLVILRLARRACLSWERGERTRMRQRAREGFRLRASAVDHLAQRGEVATRMPRASRPRP